MGKGPVGLLTGLIVKNILRSIDIGSFLYFHDGQKYK
jgi:hypothetical protein